MDEPSRHEVTRILEALRAAEGSGDAPAPDRAVSDRLFELVYAEMRRLAGALMRSERPGHSLQPTALVHEAYIRLVDGARVDWQDRAHFVRVAVRAMRRVLVDHARRRASQKAGGGQERVTIERAVGLGSGPEVEVLELDDLLARLATLDPRMAQGVELRVFGGLKEREIASVLGVSERTVRTDWTMAKAWLARELTRDA